MPALKFILTSWLIFFFQEVTKVFIYHQGWRMEVRNGREGGQKQEARAEHQVERGQEDAGLCVRAGRRRQQLQRGGRQRLQG